MDETTFVNRKKNYSAIGCNIYKIVLYLIPDDHNFNLRSEKICKNNY
jgi:hypothetical protein